MKMTTIYIIKQLNDNLDETIDKSKLFKEQIESARKVESLDYWLSTTMVIKSSNLKSLK